MLCAGYTHNLLQIAVAPQAVVFELISAAVPQSHRSTFLYFSAISVDLVGKSQNLRAHNGTRIPEYVLQYPLVLNDDSGKTWEEPT